MVSLSMFLSLGFWPFPREPPGPSRAIQRLRQAETPRMSSYLLGFAIGDFSVIHLEGKSPVPMALYAQRGKAGLGNDMLVEWWL